MHAKFVTLWLQVVQPLTNVHETKWTPHDDVAQSSTSSDFTDKRNRITCMRLSNYVSVT